MVCRYGEKNDGLVRVYLTAEGGIHVDINEEMKSAENSEALLNALIRSTSDSLFSNYLQIHGYHLSVRGKRRSRERPQKESTEVIANSPPNALSKPQPSL